MKPIADDPGRYARERLMVPRTKLPAPLQLHEELGKGANNRVFRATLFGQDCVLRAPRRGSDTQQRGSAVWEFRHTLKASQLGVGPALYQAWCARHAHEEWPSGLYLVTERMPHDLDAVLCDDAALRPLALARRDDIGAAAVACLRKLADERIFVFDLKPSNVMVRLHEDAGADVRVIDFGRDFCEWAGAEQDPDSRTPVLDKLRKLARAQEPEWPMADIDAVARHVLFVAMLVVLSATTTRALRDDRRAHRMGAAERAAIHPFSRFAAEALDAMQGRHVELLREVLRTDEVRGVLQHYHGRRDAGTRRTLRYARGLEHGPAPGAAA